MIDFNPAWIYALAKNLTRLETVQADVQMADHAHVLFAARGIVDEFLFHQQHTLFPDTCSDLVEVLKAIDVVAPPDARLVHQVHVMNVNEVSAIHAAVARTIDTFERECPRKYIVGLEKQRALEPKTLIEEIESAISPECWKRLSIPTKKEIEECGKCLAFERYTAAGFHILRGVENEIRDYVCLLLYDRPKKRDIGHYIDVLKQNGADPKLIASLDNIRNLDRNPLMHPEDWLERDDAIGVFNMSQVAFERLISDMENKRLLPPSGV